MEKNEIKNNILKTICFVFLAIFLFLIANKFSQKNITLTRWYAFKQLPENSLDILFLGNSHSFCSVSPEIIDTVLNTTSFNLGISAETIAISYYELIEVLKTQQPKIVVLETFVLDLYPERNHQYFYEFLWNSTFSIKNIEMVSLVINDPEDYLKTISLINQHDIVWKNPSQNFMTIEKNIENINEDNLFKKTHGFLPREALVSDEDLFSITLNAQLPSNPHVQNIEYFDKFVALCEKNNINLILMEVPYMKSPPAKTNTWGPFNKEELSIQYKLPLFTLDKTFMTKTNYSDVGHLSSRGAYEFSLKVASFLSENYNYAINKDAVNYYESFLIEDLIINKELTTTTITVVPPKSESSKTTYLWYLKNNDGSSKNFNIKNSSSIVFENTLDIRNVDLRIINQSTKEVMRLIIPLY